MSGGPAPAATGPSQGQFPGRFGDDLIADSDVLVVGGGIVGCSAAYYIAREGVEVTLIDRADLNSQASGTNAGSLHLMIISRFFKRDDPQWIAGRDSLLSLLAASIGIWRELADELGCDIELSIRGGLMVAESDEQLGVLERKAAVERRHGLKIEILAGADLPALAPYLSEHLVGAAFCSQEGSVNPAVATPAIARAARNFGARVLCRTSLTALQAQDGRFVAATNRGLVRCRRVINAAGSDAPAIAAMVGVPIPLQSFARHMNVTEAAPPLIQHLVQHSDRLLSLKQAASGNIIIGGGWPAVLDPRTEYPTVRRPSTEGSLWTALRVAPRLRGLALIRTWAGIISLTPDGGAILGEVPGRPGFYNAIAPNSGYTGGPVCGRLLAELITGRAPTLDVRGWSIERFGSLPGSLGTPQLTPA